MLACLRLNVCCQTCYFDGFTFPYATKSTFHSHTKSSSHFSQSITPQQVYHFSTLPIIPILPNDNIDNLNSVSFESSSSSHSFFLEQ